MRAKDLPRAVSIMPCTEQANIVRRGRATEREGMSMLEREIAPLAAALSIGIDEAALAAVPFPYEAGHFSRHVP